MSNDSLNTDVKFMEESLSRGFIPIMDVVVSTDEAKNSMVTAELANLGFAVSTETLSYVSDDFQKAALDAASNLSGHGLKWKPLYPDFPHNSEEMSIINSVAEKVNENNVISDVEPEPRSEINEEDTLVNCKPIVGKTFHEINEFAENKYIKNNVAFSEFDTSFLASLFSYGKTNEDTLVEALKSAPNRENISKTLQAYASSGNSLDSKSVADIIKSQKNPDGILRVALALYSEPSTNCENDYDLVMQSLNDSLSYAFRMKNVPTRVRKAIVLQLGKTTKDYRADSLISKQNLWRKVLKSIHSFCYVKNSDSKRALDIIHGNIEHKTLNSVIEEHFDNNDIPAVVDTLVEYRPIELLRKTARIASLSTMEDIADLVQGIIKSAEKAPLSTIISAYNGVLDYNNDNKIVKIVGMSNHMSTSTNKIDEGVQADVLAALRDSMYEKLSKAEFDGSLALPEVEAPVSLVKRDVVAGDKEMLRGQKVDIDFENYNVIRLFTHWFNIPASNGRREQSVDIDLSAGLMDKNFSMKHICTWNNYDSHSSDITKYSGDKTSAPISKGGASEFIDVNVEEALKSGIEWVLMSAITYTGNAMKELDSIYGYMLRSDNENGEIFEPRSIATSFRSNSPSVSIIPLAINIKEGYMLWIDTSDGTDGRGVTMISNSALFSNILKNEVSSNKVSYTDIVEMISQSQGMEINKESSMSVEELDGIIASL